MENDLFDFLCDVIQNNQCAEDFCRNCPLDFRKGSNDENCKFLILRMRNGCTQFQRD